MQETTIQRQQTGVKLPVELAAGQENAPGREGVPRGFGEPFRTSPHTEIPRPAATVIASNHAPLFGMGDAGKAAVRNGPAADPRSV